MTAALRPTAVRRRPNADTERPFDAARLAEVVEKTTGSVDMHRSLGIGNHRWDRFVREGLTAFEADEMAVRLNLHPLDIWGEAWIEESLKADRADRVAARRQADDPASLTEFPTVRFTLSADTALLAAA